MNSILYKNKNGSSKSFQPEEHRKPTMVKKPEQLRIKTIEQAESEHSASEQPEAEQAESENMENKLPKVENQKWDNDPSIMKFSEAEVNFFNKLSFTQQISAHNFIAFDIDTDKIRYISGKSAGKNILIKESGVYVFPSTEKDRNKALQLTLDNIKTNAYKSGYKVHVSFFSPDVSIRQFILPKMRKSTDLENAINYKLLSDLPGFNEKSHWKYRVLEEFVEGGSKQLRVVVLIVPGDVINNLISMFENTGLIPETIIPRSVALHQAFEKMVPDTQSDMLVDISYDSTHINYITDGNLQYTRSLATGAANLEVAVHDKKDKILGPDTFKMQEEEGISKSGALRPDKIRKSLQQRLKVLQVQQNPVLQLFKNELQHSSDHFDNLKQGRDVKRMFLTGYGIQKESLLSFLKNNMKIPVFVLSPKFKEKTSNNLSNGQYFSTIGTVIDANNPFNLVPKEFRSHVMFKRLSYFVIVIMLLTFAGAFRLASLSNEKIDQLNTKLSEVQNQYNLLNPIEVEYQQYSTGIKKVKDEQKNLLNAVVPAGPVVEIMRVISNETPEQIILESITLSQYGRSLLTAPKRKGRIKSKDTAAQFENTLTLEGSVNGDYIMSDVILINFVDHLKNLGLFKNIEITDKDKKNSKQRMSFQIKANF